MKKIFTLSVVLIMMLAMTACGTETTVTTPDNKQVSVGTIEELELLIEEDITGTTTALKTEYEELVAEIDTFEEYQENVDKVQAFYDKINDENRNLCIRMREYSVAYAELITNMDGSYDEKEDVLDDMYDTLYDDASGEIYDALYDDLMGDMYDSFYSGVVSDGYDHVPYKVWSDISSDAYDMWSNCGSDIYDEWSDFGSDVYDFWSDIYSAMWDGDNEEIEEEIIKFKEDIEALKLEE